MSKSITLTEEQYLRLLELASVLDEQAVLFSWTSLHYGTTLKIIAAGIKEVLQGDHLIDDLLHEVDETLTEKTRSKVAVSA
jgi:hypothetical protein